MPLLSQPLLDLQSLEAPGGKGGHGDSTLSALTCFPIPNVTSIVLCR